MCFLFACGPSIYVFSVYTLLYCIVHDHKTHLFLLENVIFSIFPLKHHLPPLNLYSMIELNALIYLIPYKHGDNLFTTLVYFFLLAAFHLLSFILWLLAIITSPPSIPHFVHKSVFWTRANAILNIHSDFNISFGSVALGKNIPHPSSSYLSLFFFLTPTRFTINRQLHLLNNIVLSTPNRPLVSPRSI